MPAVTASLTINIIPGTKVWCITDDCGIKNGTIVSITAEAISTRTTYSVSVNISGAGQSSFATEDVFDNIDDAINEYKLRLI